MENSIGRRRFTGAALGALVLAGCGATSDLAHYAAEQPVLDLRTYFNGTLDAWGVFQDRSGKVVKRFTVVMRCSWRGDLGVLDEDFTYSDGTKQKRVWNLQRRADGSYIGRADDVVGEAIGRISGNALQWEYTLRLPVDGKVYDVQFNDWMFLMDDQVMLNRAEMRKFGVYLGAVTLSFKKRSAS